MIPRLLCLAVFMLPMRGGASGRPRPTNGRIITRLTLLLLMLGVGADDHDIALAFDDLAFLANWLESVR